MKIFKRKWFWAIIIVLILIIGAVTYFIVSGQRAKAFDYTTEEVKKGDLLQSVSATGAIESANAIDLNFKATGRITAIKVKEGDLVKANDILARIDDASAQVAVKQAQANVLSAKAALDKVRAGASTEDINLVQQQLNKAVNDLNNLIIDLNFQSANLKNVNVDVLRSSAIVLQVALDTVNNKLLNSQTTMNLIFNDSNLYNSVTTDYAKLLDKLNTAKSSLDQIQQKSDSEINSISESFKDLLAETITFLNSSFDLSNAIIVNSYYPQTTKDAIKAEMNSQITTVNTSLSSLQSSDNNYRNSIANSSTQIKAAQNNVNILRAQLELKRAVARSFDIQSAQANLAQAQAVLDGAVSETRSYAIIAPIDGKVVNVNYKVGEQPLATGPVIRMLSDEKYQIKVDIAESDIAKIKIGNKVVIDLDAFGTERIFNGRVIFIDPAQTLIQDVVYYKTTIIFDDAGTEEDIKPGMTANVTVVTDQKESVLFIPQRAVKIKETTLDEQKVEKYVEVLVGEDTIEEKLIVTGLRADGGVVEVIAGLIEGEKVITFKKATK